MRFGRATVLALLPTAAVLVFSLHQAPAMHAENYARTASRFAQQQPTAAPTLKVYSRETIVDVTVTDAKGNPVHGLTRDDFTVKEDGKPQPIKSFAEFGTQPTKPLPKLPPNTYTNLQPPATTGATNIFLLDFLNIAALPGLEILGAEDAYGRSIAAQLAVKRDAKKFVATMSPGTRIIALGLSDNLHLLQGLTSDPALIGASLDTLQYNSDSHVSTYDQFCAQADQRVRITLEAMNQIASDAAEIKGKKNLLWFSVGIPWLTDPNDHAKCLPDYTVDLAKTYSLLAAAQVVIYPIDARGVPTMPNAFITSQGELWANVNHLPAPAWIAARNAFLQENADDELAMESIAEATGGYAFYNSNDLASLISQAVDKGSSYYTISYVPPGEKLNWAHHKIKVLLDQPGLHLVYRQTYDAVDPATIKPHPALALAASPPATGSVDMRTEMSRAMPTSTALLFDVQAEPTTEPAKSTDPQVIGVLATKLKDKPLTRYSFTYGLPGRQIAFTNGPNGTRHGSLEFDLAAYDGEGNVVTSLRQAIQLNLTADQAAQLAHSPFRYFQQLDLPPGALFLRVGILDRTSNKVGTLEIPVTVAKQVHTAEK